METALWIYAAVCVLALSLSLITREYSWVDRSWSLIPVVYVWVFVSTPRSVLIAVLVTLWGARLTFNFARKGGYARGGEDYRWAVLRAAMKPWQFQIFNVVFIVVYQNAILLLITLPAYTASRHPRSLNFGDLILTLAFLGCLVGETIADQQQWNFQQDKQSRPFLDTGLFRYSRHPNYFFEQAQWWLIFGFGANAAASIAQPTVLGAVLLTGLFIGSTMFTESISRSKYPSYDDYRRTTSMLIPWRPRKFTFGAK